MLRTRDLSPYDDSVKKIHRAATDLRELLDVQASIGGRRFESHANHHSSKRTLTTQKVGIDSKDYVKPVLKRKHVSVDERTVVEDIMSYMNRASKKQKLPTASVEKSAAVRLPSHRRILRVSGSGDSSKKLLISRNLRQSSHGGEVEEDAHNNGFHITSKARDLIEDYDERIPGKSLHIHSKFTSDTESLLSGRGYKNESIDWPQKTAQPRLSVERLEARPLLQKRMIGNQDLKDKYDGIVRHESYGLRSDVSCEESQDAVLGDELAGLIFMCNDQQRVNCFRYKVFGMPKAKLRLLDHVKPGTKLFLFEYESRQLWGIFEAASYPGIELENDAFRGSEVDFPLQVRFSIYKLCDPLTEKQFKEAIKENYFSMRKFHWDLNAEQVSKLAQLFLSNLPPVSREALHITKTVPPPSVSRATLLAFSLQEQESLPDSIYDKVSLEERSIVGQTRREILCGDNSLRKLTPSATSKLGQKDYRLRNLSEDLEFEDVDGGSSTTSGRYMSVREHVMKDLTKLKRGHLKDLNKFNDDWLNHKVDVSGEEGRHDYCRNELDAEHFKDNPSYGLGGYPHNDVLQGHVDAAYLGLSEKESFGRSFDSVPAFSTKGADPLNICLQESNGRSVKHVYPAARDLESIVYPSLAMSVKGHSAESIRGTHIDLVNARYNVRKAMESEMEQFNDLEKQLEPSVSSYRDALSSVGLGILDKNYLDAERALISQKSFLTSKSNKEVHRVATPKYESQKFQQLSCHDATGDITAVKRNFSAMADDSMDCLSTRVVDSLGKIRVTAKNDSPLIESMHDKGRIHRLDGDERSHFKENLLVSASNLEIKPSVRKTAVSPKSISNTTLSNSLLKAEATGTNQQKKLTVWSRLSAPVSTTYNTMRSRSLSLDDKTMRSRSLSLEEVKHTDEVLSEQDYETDTTREEDYYSPNEFEVIDTPQEEFVIDFKRRKNIHGSEQHTKSEVGTEKVSKDTSQENNMQNEFDAQKKRRRLIRPVFSPSNVKDTSASNAVVEKQQNASAPTVEVDGTDPKK